MALSQFHDYPSFIIFTQVSWPSPNFLITKTYVNIITLKLHGYYPSFMTLIPCILTVKWKASWCTSNLITLFQGSWVGEVSCLLHHLRLLPLVHAVTWMDETVRPSRHEVLKAATGHLLLPCMTPELCCQYNTFSEQWTSCKIAIPSKPNPNKLI